MQTTSGELATALSAARARTLSLVEHVPDAVLAAPSAPFMGPIAWDLAHIAWYEELWLLRRPRGEEPEAPHFDELFDAARRPRCRRVEVPSRSEALDYMRRVRERVLESLEPGPEPRTDEGRRLLDGGFAYRLIVQHETQHQETMLQSLALASATSGPLRLPLPEQRSERPSGAVDDEERVRVAPDRPVEIGTDERVGVFDNERPRHARTVRPFAIDRYPVTNRRFLAFVRDGGYRRDEPWTVAGRAWREASGVDAPFGWTVADDRVSVNRFGREEPLDPAEPVQHVSWFEADAFARWSGGRLPTEFEWEAAAAHDPDRHAPPRYPWGDDPPRRERANVGWLARGPLPVGTFPGGRSALGMEQALGDVYEWTATPFDGYPGFRAWPYREYSEAFFGSSCRVLRGASWAVAEPLVRVTYRNWDLPERRQLFAGLRVAWESS